MEELTENAEEPDDGEEKKEEQKLGKIQYKVRDDKIHLLRRWTLFLPYVSFKNHHVIHIFKFLLNMSNSIQIYITHCA